MKPQSCDIQRLIYYDYFLIHASDIDNDYESIHPDTPYRSGEIAIKREVLHKGLVLLCKKDLINIEFLENGIYYKASELTENFLNYFESSYFAKLNTMSKYIIEFFNDFSDEKLSNFVENKIRNWGVEFVKESIIRGSMDA